MTLLETITLTEDTTLDLGGVTITTAATEAGDYVDAFTILANVTVTGEGTIDARPSHGYTFYVGDKSGNAGSLTIENGTFYGETSVVNNRLGTEGIKGGTYAVSLEYEDDDYAYVINCIDENVKNGTAKIEVTGGTFHNFNPADNAAENPKVDFCAEGYIAVADGENYIVRKGSYVAQIGETKYESLATAIAAAENGDTVTLLTDVTTETTIDKAVNITKNGHTAKVVAGEGYELTETDTGYTITEAKKLFDLAGANVKLGDSLDIMFYVRYTDLVGTDYAAQIRRTFGDGTPDEIITVPYSQWEPYNSSMIRVIYDGLPARAMGDLLYVTIVDGDGKPVSNEWVDSIETYALRIFNNQSTKTKTVLVDMLNYGAAAQQEFGYNTSDLANAELTAEQQAYATQSVSCTDHRVKGDNYIGSSISLKNEILLTFYFNTNITADMYAVVTYTDHNGDAMEQRIEGSEFYITSKMTGVDVYGLKVADGKVLVTCTVYDASGNEVASAKDSIEGYVARMSSQGQIYEMVMKFVTSAYNYFH